MQLANDTGEIGGWYYKFHNLCCFSRYTSPWIHTKILSFCYFPNNCNFFLFGHTNLALYAHAHRLSFSVTAEDKQVETGFFGLFPETYCKLSIFDLHLSNQPKEHKRF